MPGVVEVPTLQELNVEEVNVSSAVLKAAAHHYGSQCDKANKEFMLCRWEEKDPRKCLKEGRKVNECAVNFFRQIKGNCAESFTEYWTCLDYSNLAELRHCRKQQKEFDSCVLDKLGWERPELGDLSKVTKVATSRPLPENAYLSRPRPEPNTPIEAELQPSKHGSRMFFWNWSNKSGTIVVIEPKVSNCKIPPRYPKVRSDPPTPAGNVDSGEGDLGRFAGPRWEAGVWRQGPGARGSASSDLNKGNGGQCWSTLPRHRKHALAAERNTILEFHKATARTGVHVTLFTSQNEVLQPGQDSTRAYRPDHT
ncbi:hypothetical protein QQF64_002582 [Cirrhinus molitorella]|uniref:NADH dehydrogenase [ubiquinone] 1 alpha subcomplex subunit 8 n=2 Tax=Cirrhinus molitorella TaxID=172907 RepID=A0ABR3MQI3_9TELE